MPLDSSALAVAGAASIARVESAVVPPAETVLLSRRALRRRLASDLSLSLSPSDGGVPRSRRHASDLTAELPAVGALPAEVGRHRAPGVQGRHRASVDGGAAGEAVSDGSTSEALARRVDFGTEVLRWDVATGPAWAARVAADR